MKPGNEQRCGVCETPYFERNNYYYGKQFTVRDLLQEQTYFNEKRWLVNRMVLGWGVVCGLEVRWDREHGRLVVGQGMALDCCGREIIVCEEQQVEFGQYEEEWQRARRKPDYEARFVLCLEYHKCKTEPVELPPLGCDKQGRTEYNRIREGFKLLIKRWEDACPKQPYGRANCIEHLKHDGSETETAISCRTPSLHERLCSLLTEGCPECEYCDCVVLATITVRPQWQSGPAAALQQQAQGEQKQGDEQQGQYKLREWPGDGTLEVRVDPCTDRRFVYNNPLLYDLIYCHHGDLPHIVDFSWREAAYPRREVGWDTFVRLMESGLTVYFDQEMAEESLNAHTFFLNFFDRQDETGTFVVKRIPAEAIRTDRRGDCYTATFVTDRDWVDDELKKKNSELAVGVDVEITLRGSRIWSKQGKALDGDFVADKLPTGNGTQGGDFVDWFRVRPRGADKPKADAYDF